MRMKTSSVRVNHNDETHQLSNRSPQQVMHGIAEYDPLFVIHEARCLLVHQALFEQQAQLDLAAIHPGAPTPTRFCCILNVGCPSHGIRAHANHEMIVLREQALDHLPTHVGHAAKSERWEPDCWRTRHSQDSIHYAQETRSVFR
jgi:hypothetical protein